MVVTSLQNCMGKKMLREIYQIDDKNVKSHMNLKSVEEELIKWLDSHSFDKIVIKPNWVDMKPLTRTELDIFTLVTKICSEKIKSVLVADCPLDKTNFNNVKAFYKSALSNKNIKVLNLSNDEFETIDLGEKSLFMPLIEVGIKKFMMGSQRTTPQKYHFDTRHEYGVSKIIYQSEGIIHLPRLKTHRLAGMTGCSKSYIGTVVKKYWLPHYTLDYDQMPLPRAIERRLKIKQVKETLHLPTRFIPYRIRKGVLSLLHAQDKIDSYLLGAAWEGNDTIWRTIDDLLLIYKRHHQFYILDGRVAGQGEGPLLPDPLILDKIWTGINPIAIDNVGSLALEEAKAKAPTRWTSPYSHNRIKLLQYFVTGDASPVKEYIEK